MGFLGGQFTRSNTKHLNLFWIKSDMTWKYTFKSQHAVWSDSNIVMVKTLNYIVLILLNYLTKVFYVPFCTVSYWKTVRRTSPYEWYDYYRDIKQCIINQSINQSSQWWIAVSTVKNKTLHWIFKNYEMQRFAINGYLTIRSIEQE